MKLSLQYLIREPKVKKDKNPLLLLLHGYGSNEADLFSFATELPDEYYVVAARAPYDLQYGSYAWYAINFDAGMNKFTDDAQAKVSRDAVVKFIGELTDNYPIDKQNVTLVGFSQGSILSYAVAVSNPEIVQQVAALSGYIHEPIFENVGEKDYSNVRRFASHGSVDQVIPVQWARLVEPYFEKLNIAIEYREYPVGHGVAPQNFNDLLNWLVRK